MPSSKPTRGQVERTLTQRIQALYQEQTGKRPEKVTCQPFDEKFAIVIEKIITRSEQLLLASDRLVVAQEFRAQLDAVLKPKLIALIEEVIQVPVITLLNNSDLACDCAGMIAFLEDTPVVRDPQTIPKVKPETLADTDSEQSPFE